MEQAIKKAIEEGWKQDVHRNVLLDYFLDPLFWQALGKAMGWGKYEKDRSYPRTWKDYQHVLIDAIQDGNDADSFFNQLLK